MKKTKIWEIYPDSWTGKRLWCYKSPMGVLSFCTKKEAIEHRNDFKRLEEEKISMAQFRGKAYSEIESEYKIFIKNVIEFSPEARDVLIYVEAFVNTILDVQKGLKRAALNVYRD